MKTIPKLIRRFKRLYPEYEAWFDEVCSYKGCYRIAITEPVLHLTSDYIFSTCQEFEEWIDGVVLE